MSESAVTIQSHDHIWLILISFSLQVLVQNFHPVIISEDIYTFIAMPEVELQKLLSLHAETA